MLDAAVEGGEQGGSLIGDDRGFEVGAGEGADGFEGAPGGFDGDFDFIFEAAQGDGGAEIAWGAAKFGQNILGKVLEIFGQLCLGGAGGPAEQDPTWSWKLRGGRGLVADDDIPGADFPFFDKSVLDVRVVTGKRFGFGFVIHVEND